MRQGGQPWRTLCYTEDMSIARILTTREMARVSKATTERIGTGNTKMSKAEYLGELTRTAVELYPEKFSGQAFR